MGVGGVFGGEISNFGGFGVLCGTRNVTSRRFPIGVIFIFHLEDSVTNDTIS